MHAVCEHGGHTSVATPCQLMIEFAALAAHRLIVWTCLLQSI